MVGAQVDIGYIIIYRNNNIPLVFFCRFFFFTSGTDASQERAFCQQQIRTEFC